MRSIGRAAKRRLGRMRAPRQRAIILMYHRIAEDSLDPWGLNVSPAHFAEHLDVISQRATALSLNALLDALDADSLPERGVVITFDDGYADNLHAAKPLLERHAMPATVFVVAGMLGSTVDFWWDELQQLIFTYEGRSVTIELPVGDEVIRANLPGERPELDSGWRFHDSPPSGRYALYQKLWKQIQPLPETERRKTLDCLQRQLGGRGPESTGHRIMTDDELLSLADGGLVEIGAHTMTHPVLSQIPLIEGACEITESRARLERLLGMRVTNFAYPHGGPNDYTPETAFAVRNAGLRSACTTTEGWPLPSSDRYHLPRIYVPDLDAGNFERLLREWL